MFDDTAGGDRLCGFFDFYFAGVDLLLFDIAVCLNDWCTDLASGRLDEARARAFMRAYEGVRALDGAEHRLLPALLARQRCASGCRGCGTGTCRAMALLQQGPGAFRAHPARPSTAPGIRRCCTLTPWR
jgi:Ser/Thr protein kinase RdoA (MazF antagonist)